MMQAAMDTFPFLAAWLSTATPVLPGLTLVHWAQPLLWGVVLAGLAAKLLARQPRGVRCITMAAVGFWMLLPGSWSPAWWLGLAFQLPSHVSVMWCAGLVWTGWHDEAGRAPSPVATQANFGWLQALALLMGALLLADMFILLPFSLYRWGFSSFAFGLLLAAVLLAWLLARQEATRRDAQWVCAALALFALTRLPSGNVFDAVIDPWLWMVLLAHSLQQGYRRIKSGF